MKQVTFLLCPVLFLSWLLTPLAAQGQQNSCRFDISGTWQFSTNGQVNPTRFRFGSNGVLTELSRKSSDKASEWQGSGQFTYKLDDPKNPKVLVMTAANKSGGSPVDTTLQIKTFDEGLFVTAPGDAAPLTKWTRVDKERYFVVLASGKGDPGFGGAGFAMLVKTDGVHTQTDAYGVYPVVNRLERHPVLGEIPEILREQFHNEPAGDSGAMLRLEVTAGPYNRALEVMQTWERRSDEDTLLYTVPYLNNAVYLNQLTSSLNEMGVLTWSGGTPCSETIKLQKLTWRLSDQIMTKHNLTQTPYYLFKTLRELNNSRHLDDTKFYAALAGDDSAAVALSARK